MSIGRNIPDCLEMEVRERDTGFTAELTFLPVM